MHPVTVAIADTDHTRQASYEHSLQGDLSIKVLTNASSSTVDMTTERRRKSRADISPIENTVARVRRLSPRVLLANMDECLQADCAMLVSLRRECPDTVVLLVSDEAVREEQIIKALANGARGCLSRETQMHHFSKAVHVVDCGEAWVPRKMLGKIMDEVRHWSHECSMEDRLDSAS